MNCLLRNLNYSLLLLSALTLSACSGGSNTNTGNDQFSISAITPTEDLLEGDPVGVSVDVTVKRVDGYAEPLTLTASTSDQPFISTNFSEDELTLGNNTATLNVSLAIADLPITAQTRSIDITASDGTLSSTTSVELLAQPTTAPDIYLLIGQSNMIGFSGDGTKQAFPGGLDEPNPRIKQLNVSKNDQDNIFLAEDDFSSVDLNAVTPLVVQAEDPLHIPLDPNNTTGKTLSYIGLGLSFAKDALVNTTADIVLVPAAWSGAAFCDNEGGPIGQWNAGETDDPNLGNSWLFERAKTRANMAIDATGGVLRGILWHQGESDANDRCAGSYAENLTRLAEQLRLQIQEDVRGSDLRRADANIPFITGSMSKGVDERDDLSVFLPDKLTIDAAHRTIAERVTHAAFSNHDDLVPDNGFPCGNTTCIHFGPQALREMGARYYQALLAAANNP
jgi:hypothetical protein